MQFARNSVGNRFSRLVYTEVCLKIRYRNVVSLIYPRKIIKNPVIFTLFISFHYFRFPIKSEEIIPSVNVVDFPLPSSFLSATPQGILRSFGLKPNVHHSKSLRRRRSRRRRSSIIRREGKCLNCVSLNTSGARGNAIWLDFLLRLGTVNDRQLVKVKLAGNVPELQRVSQEVTPVTSRVHRN